MDCNGAPVASLHHKLMSFLASFKVMSKDESTQLFTVNSKFAFFKSKLVADVTNLYDGKAYQVVIKGGWRDKHVKFSVNDKLIACMSRKTNLKHILFEKQDYFLEIEPGVDSAMIVMMALAFDEAENDKN